MCRVPLTYRCLMRQHLFPERLYARGPDRLRGPGSIGRYCCGIRYSSVTSAAVACTGYDSITGPVNEAATVAPN